MPQYGRKALGSCAKRYRAVVNRGMRPPSLLCYHVTNKVLANSQRLRQIGFEADAVCGDRRILIAI
jgi:hypothetical protein